MKRFENQIKEISNMVGNTPLLEIELIYKGTPRIIFAKAEHYNLTGSIKDRVAVHIVRKAKEYGYLKKETTIIEATSGNTGISFAAVGSALGFPVTIFMPDWMSEERKKLISSYGADIVLVSKEQGGFLGSISESEKLAASLGNSFLPKQFSNNDNCEAHYLSTGPEIWAQLQSAGRKIDAFVAGVGTGGTLMGTGMYLRKMNPKARIHPMEPANSPTLTTGYKSGKHRIEGISDEFVPDIIKLDQLDDIISVDDGDAILMAQKLSRELGLGVGISSGANLIGSLIAQEKLGTNACVATVFSDDNKKYLSTDLMKSEPVKDNFYSKDIQLIGYKSWR